MKQQWAAILANFDISQITAQTSKLVKNDMLRNVK
jgi:hypothetical protein